MARTTAAAAVVAGIATGAAAQTRCAPRAIVVERLAGHYGEAFAGGGLRDEGAVFEVWTSAEEGTWTILLTRPNGVSCVMASGTNWRDALASEGALGFKS